MAKIVVIGSLNMDIVAVAPRLPRAGETLIGREFLSAPGGKGANQAYAAARLGGEVAMLGRVGGDDHGKRMIANLAAAGCDVSGVQRVEAASGVAVIVVTDSGQNSIVVIPGANHRYQPSDLAADEARVRGAQVALLQLELPLETVGAAVHMVKRHNARVILDPAPAPPALPRTMLQQADILTPNETEATQLAGKPPGELNVDEARTIARHLQAAGAKTVIIKLGAQGCLLLEADVATLVPAPAVDAVDTTAAGDVFNGGLAVACTEGAPLIDACRFAVRAASLSVKRLGAQRSMPSRAELSAWAAAHAAC